MSTGGSHPYPETYGGGKPLIKSLLESLNAGCGTAIDTSPGTVAYVENMSYARELASVWRTNRRLSMQNDPQRMTVTLTRWERILGLARLPTDTDFDRRARVMRRWSRIGKASLRSLLTSELTASLGSVFVAVYTLTLAESVAYWPGGTPSTTWPWTSTLAHILVKLQKPNGMSESQFYDKACLVAPLMDELIPCWCTASWYRSNTAGNTGAWGTDTSAGFWLDHPLVAGGTPNLDNMVFDG